MKTSIDHKATSEATVNLKRQREPSSSSPIINQDVVSLYKDSTSANALQYVLTGELLIETPILTNVSTRDRMAIIKIDTEAISQCRKLIHEVKKIDKKGCVAHLKCATTELFTLAIKNDEGHVTEIDVRFKLFLDGCSEVEAGKFVSVFVEISNLESRKNASTFFVTLFLRNLKDEKGSSFKKSIKVTTTSGSRVERGIREFVSIEEFDQLMKNESIVSFGLLISP